MKHIILLFALLFLLSQPLHAQRPNLQLGFQAGINGTYLEARLDDPTELFGVGYQGGIYFRVTKKRGFGEIGLNFIRSVSFSSKEEMKNDINLEDNLVVFNTEIPIMAGYKLIKTPFTKWRLYSGLNVSFTGKTFNEEISNTSIRRKDFQQPHLGVRVGTGVDIAFFTLDMNYTLGMTNALKFDFWTQSHFWMFNGGVVF